uniref:Neutrophil cytosolic factor 2 n=1 Tax=Cyprinus carpio TaxID=7962 RepID=A0A8C2D4R7_CYPCA
MSFVSTLRQWDEAVACVEQRDPASALRIFLNIEEKNSKIFFNIGCLYLNNSELDEAEKAFDRSIGKDEHLAAAFFQRGVTFYKKERYESLLDFQQAFKQLRGNQLIDYKPLGLRYKLYACEVLHNIGLVQAQLGKWEKAQENLLTALSLRADAKFSHIDHALDAILKQKLFPLVEIRAGLLFKPNKHYVAELEKRDYLGKAKVVSSIVPADEFSGFAPLQPQVDNVPSTPKVPEVLRVFEGEPHTVLYEFYPETKEELAVLPGNIVFVLQKGADNWASVVFNEKVYFCVNFMVTIPIRTFPAPYRNISGEKKSCNVPFSYAKEGVEERVNLEESEMEAVWNSVKDNRLALWCSVTESKSVPHEKVVALYSYASSTPEDLDFEQGNIITVLSKVNDEWLEGQCNGKVGIFPSSFVKALNGDQQCE